MHLLTSKSTYEDFISGLTEYKAIYEKGLKKDANKELRCLLSSFERELSIEKKEDFLFRLCSLICDDKEKTDIRYIIRRGNGRLPYELDKLIWNYIRPKCESEQMPFMLWAWLIYQYNPFESNFDAKQMLKKAYHSSKCDEKTANTYFDMLLSDLDWGAHHFPKAMIIEKEYFESLVEECERVLKEKRVKDALKNEYMYYCSLYKCYFEYEKDGRINDFKYYCDKAKISYNTIVTVYYDEGK